MEVVRKQNGEENALVHMSGIVDENAALDQRIGPVAGELRVNCSGITRFNSVGVKAWIGYFQNLRARGVKLRFAECTNAVVSQCTMFMNFIPPEELESMYMPFLCEDCDNQIQKLLTTAELKENNLQLPEVRCSKCGEPAVFDDVLDDYVQLITG